MSARSDTAGSVRPGGSVGSVRGVLHPGPARGEQRGKRAADRPEPAVQAELAQ
jgi:hypothetical protein